jgi:REP element-mobilizing transposase RayT
MARGIERRPIFVDDRDRMDLLDRLRELAPESGAVFYAWAFMPNHVHFVVRSGHDSLSRLMKRIHTGFAVRFNLRHERVGYLFQNRFRSRLVTGDDDLQGLVRYVHLNPVQAGIVADLRALESWRWSGYPALMGRRTAFEFEEVGSTLSMFDNELESARTGMRRWMAEGLEVDHSTRLTASASECPDADPGSDQDLEMFIERACRYYGVSAADLVEGVRSDRVSRARALICHVAVARLRMSHVRIARRVGVSQPAVCQALPRGLALAREDGERVGLPTPTSPD